MKINSQLYFSMIYRERFRRVYEFLEVTRFASSLILRASHRKFVVLSLSFVETNQLATLIGIFQILEMSATLKMKRRGQCK